MIYKLIIGDILVTMMLGKKGQGWGLIGGLVIVMIAITAGFYIWQMVASGGEAMPTDPEAYAEAWKNYGDEVFAEEGQPWRVVGFFFFPLLIYFSLYFFAFSVALVGIQKKFTYVYGNIQRPIVVLSFAIAFIMLPFPTTYSMYNIIGALSPILLIFAWVIPIVGIALTFYALRGMDWGGKSTGDRGDTGKGWFDNILGPKDKDKDKKPAVTVEEEEAEDKALVEEVENLINEIEGIPKHEIWRDLFAEDVDWSRVTNEEFDRRRKLCIEYLEVLLGRIKKIYSMLRRPWGRFRRLPKEEKLKIEARLIPVEENIKSMLGGLRGAKPGEWIGVRGKIITFFNDLRKAGSDFRKSIFGYYTRVPTPRQAAEERRAVLADQIEGKTLEEWQKDLQEIRKIRELVWKNVRLSIPILQEVKKDIKRMGEIF